MTNSSIPTLLKDEPTATVTSAQRRSTLAVIVLSNLLLSFSFQIWRSLFNNFAVGELGVQPTDMGWIQVVREIPGLLGLTIGLLALLLTEMRIAGLSVILMGVGVAMTGRADSIVSLAVSTMVMSIGFHFFMPSNSSAVLMLVGEEETPRMLGRLNSLGALGAVAGAGVVYIALDRLGFRTLLYATGALVLVAGVVLFPWMRQPGGRPQRKERKEMVANLRDTPIRKRYWLYYVLEFLMGCRRHIFTTFAPFLLVETFAVDVPTITTLYLVNNLVSTFLYRQFGPLIVRFGERRVLVVNFVLLILIFLGYAYIPILPVLYFLFVTDHVLFGSRIALQSYFQKIAVQPQDITPNLSLGQTINHIAAVVIPLTGGIVWEAFGSQYTFLIGVGFVVITLIVVQWMRTERTTAPSLATVE
jgi:predicted MFS family arabinose efflux permease